MMAHVDAAHHVVACWPPTCRAQACAAHRQLYEYAAWAIRFRLGAVELQPALSDALEPIVSGPPLSCGRQLAATATVSSSHEWQSGKLTGSIGLPCALG